MDHKTQAEKMERKFRDDMFNLEEVVKESIMGMIEADKEDNRAKSANHLVDAKEEFEELLGRAYTYLNKAQAHKEAEQGNSDRKIWTTSEFERK